MCAYYNTSEWRNCHCRQSPKSKNGHHEKTLKLKKFSYECDTVLTSLNVFSFLFLVLTVEPYFISPLLNFQYIMSDSGFMLGTVQVTSCLIPTCTSLEIPLIVMSLLTGKTERKLKVVKSISFLRDNQR